jgi:hypothetical protein
MEKKLKKMGHCISKFRDRRKFAFSTKQQRNDFASFGAW